jgi:hypothetical protein
VNCGSRRLPVVARARRQQRIEGLLGSRHRHGADVLADRPADRRSGSMARSPSRTSRRTETR